MKMALILGTIVLLTILIVPPIAAYGTDGALYKVQLGNISAEQCTYASTSTRDIKFLGVITSTDPCTLTTIYWYDYQVTWKTDAEQWLLVYLGKDLIAPISIQTGERK